MTRLLTAVKTDFIVQLRNQLYTIGVIIASVVGIAFAWLSGPNQLPAVVPALLLMFIGGTTFLYVGALIFFEKQQGTLEANMISPMRISEYLWGKIITLTALSTLESAILVGLAMVIMAFSNAVEIPNIIILLVGILMIGIIYTLMGIIVIVRYDKISDFIVPMAMIVGILQLPFLYFWGVVQHWGFLLIPTSAPAMIIRGAFIPLESWEWVYASVYTVALIAGLSVWAYRAFNRHIIVKVR